MPKGQAPYPKKKNVDAGKADKAKAVQGGYKRTSKTEGYDRKITRKIGNTSFTESTVRTDYSLSGSKEPKRKKK